MKQNIRCLIRKHKEHKLVKQRLSSFHIVNQVKNAADKRLSRHSVTTKGIGMLVWSTGVHYGMFKKVKYGKSMIDNICKTMDKNVTCFSHVKKKVAMIKKILELSKKLKYKRKRKIRTEVLEMNTALLWKLACSYGEYKMKSVQRRMDEYSSENVERKLFSFKSNTTNIPGLPLFKYRFVRYPKLSNTNNYNKILETSRLNGPNRLRSSGSLETIRKLATQLDLIQEKIESLRYHLKGIGGYNVKDRGGFDDTGSDRLNGARCGALAVATDSHEQIGILGKDITTYDSDDGFLSNKTAYPMDNIEWSLNIAELEVINLLLQIYRGEEHDDQIENSERTPETCRKVLEYLPLLPGSRIKTLSECLNRTNNITYNNKSSLYNFSCGGVDNMISRTEIPKKFYEHLLYGNIALCDKDDKLQNLTTRIKHRSNIDLSLTVKNIGYTLNGYSLIFLYAKVAGLRNLQNFLYFNGNHLLRTCINPVHVLPITCGLHYNMSSMTLPSALNISGNCHTVGLNGRGTLCNGNIHFQHNLTYWVSSFCHSLMMQRTRDDSNKSLELRKFNPLTWATTASTSFESYEMKIDICKTSNNECVLPQDRITKCLALMKKRNEFCEYKPAVSPTVLEKSCESYRPRIRKTSFNNPIHSQHKSIKNQISKFFKLNRQDYDQDKLLELCNCKTFNTIKNKKYSLLKTVSKVDIRNVYQNEILLDDDKTLDCFIGNGRFAPKLSNRDSSLNVITRNIRAKAIKDNVIIKLKSKAFTLTRLYNVLTGSYVCREFCISNKYNLQELSVKSDRSEGKHVLQIKLKGNSCGVKENRRALNSLENASSLERSVSALSDKCRNIENHDVINNCSVNEETIEVVPVEEYCDREIEKMPESTRARTLALLPKDVSNNKQVDNISNDCSDGVQNQDNKFSRKMEDIYLSVGRLNEKFHINSQRKEKDFRNVYTYIYSLQNTFTIGLTAIVAKMDLLSKEENKTKMLFDRRIRKNSVVLKRTKRNFDCLKYILESKLTLDQVNNRRLRMKQSSVNKRLVATKKSKIHQIQKTTKDINSYKEIIDLKLKCALQKIDRTSNILNRDKLRLQGLIKNHEKMIENVVETLNKTDSIADSRINNQNKNIDELTDRMNYVQLRLMETVGHITENFTAVEFRLTRLENDVTNSQADRERIHVEIDNVKLNVDANQEELVDTAKQMTAMRNSISSCQRLIGDMFEEINIIKRKFDLEIRTQKEINDKVDSSLKKLNTIGRKDAASNRIIQEVEIEDFANTMKLNTLVSTASCNNLCNLSNQIDTTVINVQNKLEGILSKLDIRNTNSNSAHDIRHEERTWSISKNMSDSSLGRKIEDRKSEIGCAQSVIISRDTHET